MIPVCQACGTPTIEPFAIQPGTVGEVCAGIVVTRPISCVVWCSCPCWLRSGGMRLTSERSPNQMELVV